jgi:hypothetical protein
MCTCIHIEDDCDDDDDDDDEDDDDDDEICKTIFSHWFVYRYNAIVTYLSVTIDGVWIGE